MVEVLVSLWDQPKFSKPTNAVGDWRDVRTALFEHKDRPTAVKYAIEKVTVQLLHREPVEVDVGSPVLRYSGTSSAGGHPSTVRLELRAVRAGGVQNYLYRLTGDHSAPRRWEDEQRFVADCERRFARWCGQLRIVGSERMWAPGRRLPLADTIDEAIAIEDAAARLVEDPAPVAALQRQVLEALRSGGMGFFTAGKEGGSHLFFDGAVYRRNDYGEEPNLSDVHTDDAAMVACLRRFYDWDSQRDAYPHRKPELDIWNYIHGQLRRR